MLRSRTKAVAILAVAASAIAATTSVESVSGAPNLAPDPISFVTAPEGNSARYRVREQLAGFDLPNDAIGQTGGVTGTLTIGPDGKVSPSSKFVVDVKPLKSDKDRRDNFVQTRLLETEKFPTVDLAVTAVGIEKFPLTDGPLNFLLHGNLTVKGVTKPSLWRVTATVAGNQVSGTASTAFTFEDYDITKPHVPIVLSVGDTIKLEYDFKLIKK